MHTTHKTRRTMDLVTQMVPEPWIEWTSPLFRNGLFLVKQHSKLTLVRCRTQNCPQGVDEATALTIQDWIDQRLKWQAPTEECVPQIPPNPDTCQHLQKMTDVMFHALGIPE